MFYLMMHFILIKALSHPPFQSFPTAFIHFFQILKNFKQTLSIACV